MACMYTTIYNINVTICKKEKRKKKCASSRYFENFIDFFILSINVYNKYKKREKYTDKNHFAIKKDFFNEF